MKGKKSVIPTRAVQASGWAWIGDLKWMFRYKAGAQQIKRKRLSKQGQTTLIQYYICTLIEHRTCTSTRLLHVELWMYLHRCQSASWKSFVLLLEQKVHLFVQSVIKHWRPYHPLLMASCFGRHVKYTALSRKHKNSPAGPHDSFHLMHNLSRCCPCHLLLFPST